MATLRILTDAFNGGLGGVAATAIAYPLVIAKVKLQAQGRRGKAKAEGGDGSESSEFTGPIDVLRKVVKHEGFIGWYRGLPPALAKNFLTNFVFYLAHSVLKPLYKVKDQYTSWLGAFLHGVNAGLVVQLVMLPMEMIVTRMQAEKLGKSLSFTESTMGIWAEGGLLRFWAGLPPALTLTLNPGVTTTVQAVLTAGRKLSVSANFWVGFFSKLVASATTYPVVVVKVRMLVNKGSKNDGKGSDGAESAQRQERSMLQETAAVFLRIIKTEGVGGLYRGLEAQLWQAVAKEAILNSVRRGLGST